MASDNNEEYVVGAPPQEVGTPDGMIGHDDVSISNDAQDLEDLFYADDNDHSGETEDIIEETEEVPVKSDTKSGPIEIHADEHGNAKDPEQQGAVAEMKAEIDKGKKAAEEEVKRFQAEEEAKKAESKARVAKKQTELSDDEMLAAMMKQPFNIVMENFGIEGAEFTQACRDLFIKGHYSVTIDLLGLKIVLRSKNMNNHVDFADYMRRILIGQISQREFETLRQLRQLSYAIVEYGDEDWSELDIKEKFDKLLEKDEMAITMLINASVNFWRISHLMMHPGALSFLEIKPQT